MKRALVPVLVSVPHGLAAIGSSIVEIEAAVDEWADRLVSQTSSRAQLRSWLLKEHPNHRVEVAGLRMGRDPVTQAEYGQFVSDTGITVPLSGLERPTVPVWGVDTYAAATYCSWLSDHVSTTVRLPTETEWEWAARGPRGLAYPWGDKFDSTLCNTVEAGVGEPTPVGTYEGASWCGLRDMAGNVEEWVSTSYSPYPGGTHVEDDISAAHPEGYTLLRGGSCRLSGDTARGARRHGGPLPGELFRYTGFRIAVPTPDEGLS